MTVVEAIVGSRTLAPDLPYGAHGRHDEYWAPVPERCHMMAFRPHHLAARLAENLVLRSAIYYALLFASVAVLWRACAWLPAAMPSVTDAMRTGGGAADTLRAAVAPRDTGTLAPTVLLAMATAVLLSLPIAWVYRLTRSKRGYQQSVVQTLVILPMIVAGVVVLVKDSLALAFGLAGIVAAVRFRTALDDSKDAMYVFLATGIGLAAAVDLPVAAVLSVFFNVIILLLWYTEFGRQPAHLDGAAGDRRLQQALDHLSRTGTFVARVDEELFRDMSSEQLQALMSRAERRAHLNEPQENGAAEERQEMVLRVRTHEPDSSRRVVEPILGSVLKRWRYGGVQPDGDGTAVIAYHAVLRKNMQPAELLEYVRTAVGEHVIDVELE